MSCFLIVTKDSGETELNCTMAVFGRAYPSIAYKQKQHVVFGVLAYHQLLPKAGLLKPEKRKSIDGRFWKQKPRLNTVALVTVV